MPSSGRCCRSFAIILALLYMTPLSIFTTTVPVTDFDYIVEDNHDLSFLPVSPPTEVDKTIASYIMPFIHDGDTVQIGMGGLGEQITQELRCKKNIQIYTEITVDSMVDLVDCGAVTHVATCGAYGSPKQSLKNRLSQLA